MLKNILIVGLGGAAGSIFRYLATLAGNALHCASWIVTLSVNSIGSFLIGFFMAACVNGDWKLMLTVGLCGGFTTLAAPTCLVTIPARSQKVEAVLRSTRREFPQNQLSSCKIMTSNLK